MKFSKNLKSAWPFLVLLVVISFTFKTLPRAFFQQDEWSSFGAFLYRQSRGGVLGAAWDAFLTGKIHFNPILRIIGYLQFKYFYLNFPFYAFASLGLLLVNAFLVYCFFLLLIKNKVLSFLTAVLFSANSLSHQAVTWISASLQTQGATLFSLLFAILLFKKRFFWALFSIFMALMFKETALPFFLLAAILFCSSRKPWTFNPRMKRTRNKLIEPERRECRGLLARGSLFFSFKQQKKGSLEFRKILLPTGIFLIFYLFLRTIVFLKSAPVILGLSKVQEQPHSLVHFYRAITLPFKLFPQTIFPNQFLLNFSRKITHLSYPHFVTSDNVANPYLVETAGLDLVNYLLSGLVFFTACFAYRIFKKQKRDNLASALIISFLIIIGGALLIIFIPGRAGYASIIEPRHLYQSVIGSSLFLVLIVYAFSSLWSKNKALLLTVILVVPLIGMHIKLVEKDLTLLEERSVLRKSLLVTVKETFPSLPPKVVFYVRSDRVYYGQPPEEKNLPVQSGFGRMLMVWYQETEKFPACFYQDVFLHDLKAQGYRECEGRGFGYFRDYEKMKAALAENQIPIENVFGFSWKGETAEFKNITQEVRTKILKDETL